MLEQELETYARHEEEWAAQYPGKFVLVKGAELVGTFDSLEDALTQGARRFGLESFLVRKTGEPMATVSVPALTLGVLHADPSYPVQHRRG